MIDVQWWLAELDRYGNPTLVDGPHSDAEGCEKALYLRRSIAVLARKVQGKRFAAVRVQIFPVEAKSHDSNHEAIAILNAAGA